jgi:uncharacterized damage-inducible protein DinB
MNKADIDQLYRYNKWANDSVLNAVASLSAEQLTRRLEGSFSSVRDTLVHLMAAEWIWLRRWKGVSPRALLEPAEFPDFAALKSKWAEIQSEQMDFVNQLTDQALEQIIAYTNVANQPGRFPLGRLMQHVANHSTYHRGQITNFLRQLGAQPVATDFIVYLRDVEKAVSA